MEIVYSTQNALKYYISTNFPFLCNCSVWMTLLEYILIMSIVNIPNPVHKPYDNAFQPPKTNKKIKKNKIAWIR